MFTKQINSWEELDEKFKMVAFVHLEKKGVSESQDGMGKMEQRVEGEKLDHKGRGVRKES